MKKHITKWYSPSLNKDMEIVQYGHFGFALLLIPTAAADYLEYERFLLIDALAPYIESGKCKVYSINSINTESWLNNEMHGYWKAVRHQQFNNYVTEEVVPYIFSTSGGWVPVITSGASFGALHAANLFFRRPDLFGGTIAMSGSYDLTDYTKDYFDENVYFNSPAHYLPNWNDEHMLGHMRNHKPIIIATGQGAYEKPSASIHLSNILNSKGVNHWLDVWGTDVRHDWPTWRSMLPYFIGNI